ncbi:hypothetical protein I302_105922 [Kwoniella bestiolae CBS 10118]|uniref:Peroxin/Ferlin domain-containing protein n=1 Tax=Kwoniella bestiolae CBS 10118 TaxID=1296100 RepID=A0A1B9G2I4_9TREE|nr:hypothetical protein I302_05046 [Kwoniella bestiolae CBS 10118]OCF25233.1 hypothetical protein I302_05046 [Kwoniella bestiolae CBS 10118]
MAPTSSIPQAGSLDPPPPVILQSSDLVSSLPAPFLRLLVLFARPMSFFRTLLEVILWRSGRRVQSWMVVGAWWAVCLGSSHAFRYLLPALLFIPFIPLSKLRLKSPSKQPLKNTSAEPSTSDTLLTTLSDVNAIYALLPPSPLPRLTATYERFRQLGPIRLLRGMVVIWITWVMLGQIIGYSTLLGITGSIFLLLPSPPLSHLINLLSKSLFMRRSLALIFLFTFGSPPESSYRFTLSHFSPVGWFKSKWRTSRRPSLTFSFKPKMSKMGVPSGSAIDDTPDEEAEKETKVEQPIYFRFEVHENQRWWMGLDWTSALLPQERPSWCDNHLQPVSPPQSFTLPPPTSIVVPSPTDRDPKAQVLRTASWKWLDDDWTIVKQGPGLSGQTIVPSPTIPQHDDHFTVPSPNTQDGKVPSGSRPTSIVSTSPPKSGLEETLSPGARAQSIAEQAFTKGLERLKARTASVALSSNAATAIVQGGGASSSSPRKTSDTTSFRQRTMSQTSDDSHHTHAELDGSNVQMPLPGEVIVEKDDATDGEGWVYGDNKWENMGAKGGLGKFTRRRRWTRRAILIETVIKLKSTEEPSSEPTMIVPPSGVRTPLSGETVKSKPTPAVAVPVRSNDTANSASMVRAGSKDSKKSDKSNEEKSSPAIVTATGITSGTASRDDVLRSRLKKAMGSVGG